MLDRSLLCAPLLVPAFLGMALWPTERVGEAVRAAGAAPRTETVLVATPAALPSADTSQDATPRHEGCSGKRKAAHAAATTTAT